MEAVTPPPHSYRNFAIRTKHMRIEVAVLER